ncbi:MAG TPA: molybdopterin-dependent oxidoreductase [Rhizomicrobium sp.]|jgi:DMSO/TMAO reductase YedYZ molybdopterin-dependent catalytic subunit
MRVLGPAAALLILLATPALADGITLTGAVQHPGTFTMAELRALPEIDVTVNQLTDKGSFAGKFHGVPLWTLVNSAMFVNGPERNSILRHAILVSSSADGYGAVVSLGEIHPKLGNGQVILATEENGQPLTAPILIVPGDGHAARDVRNVTDVTVQ